MSVKTLINEIKFINENIKENKGVFAIKVKKLNSILDYIDELEEENKNLKEEHKELVETNYDLAIKKTKLEEENKKLEEELKFEKSICSNQAQRIKEAQVK